MKTLTLFPLLFLVAISTSTSATQQQHKPRLHRLPLPILRQLDSVLYTEPVAQPKISKDLQTHYYKQTLDHFNYNPQSYATFKQRYVVSSKYWGGGSKNSPIFAYFGAEASLENDLGSIGFLPENAPRFQALQVYIEHRFYGKSNPVGSMEKALNNETIRGYFNSAQALADYAEVLLYLKRKYNAYDSPVIVIGASYGGMLASWFRLKYPHIALGALASSAPILYFDHIIPRHRFYSRVTKDFQEVSDNCYQTIQKSWSEIDRIASKHNGLRALSKKFRTCKPLKQSSDLTDYLKNMYESAAQYNAPPSYPVTMVCGGIDRAPKGSDILRRIFGGVVAYNPNKTCYINTKTSHGPSETSLGWTWQMCSEMVMPIGINRKNKMFQPSPFNLTEYAQECKDYFGVQTRPHWITTYYGGQDINLVLKKFASNIIFSNGLRDPYSTGGVLENLSDSLQAVYTVNGSHCLDVITRKPTDPQWLVRQRIIEVKIIRGWLKKYYGGLLPTQKNSKV